MIILDHISVILEHPLHDTLKNTIEVASTVRSTGGIQQDHLDKIDRTYYVLQLLKALLRKVDPLLISVPMMDNIQTNVNQIHSYLLEYPRNPSHTIITNCIANVDSVCSQMRNIYIPTGNDEVESIRDSAVSFRQSLAQHLRHATKDADEQRSLMQQVQSELQELRRRIDNENVRVDNTTAEFQRQYSESEANRIRDFNKVLEEQKRAFDSDLQTMEVAFSELETSLKERHSGLEDATKSTFRNLDQEGQRIIKILQTHQESAKKILGTISVDGHAAGYKIEADKARKAKHLWQIITGVLFVAVIASAIANMLHEPERFTWAFFATKWAVTLAIGAAVTYSARQASKLDQLEFKNRSMELQMATIDPYLEIFNEDERKEIKKILVDRIFTGVPQSEDEKHNEANISTGDIGKIIESVGTAMKNSK